MAFIARAAGRALFGATPPPPPRPLREEVADLRRELARRDLTNRRQQEPANDAFANYAATIAIIGLVEAGLIAVAPAYYGLPTAGAIALKGIYSQLGNIYTGGAPYQSLLGRVQQAAVTSIATLAALRIAEALLTNPPHVPTDLALPYEGPKVLDYLGQLVKQILPTILIPVTKLTSRAILKVPVAVVGLANVVPNILVGDSAFGQPYSSVKKRFLQTALIAATALTIFSLARPYLPEAAMPVTLSLGKTALSYGFAGLQVGYKVATTAAGYLYSAGSALRKVFS